MKMFKRAEEWLFDAKHPLRGAAFCLGAAGANVYEALYVDNPNGVMQILSWTLMVGGILGFFIFLGAAISNRFSKSE